MVRPLTEKNSHVCAFEVKPSVYDESVEESVEFTREVSSFEGSVASRCLPFVNFQLMDHDG